MSDHDDLTPSPEVDDAAALIAEFGATDGEDSGPGESETTESETAEAKGVEPETAEPETIETETAEPETAEPETIETEGAEPETVEPETVEAETVEAETAESEPVEPETVEPETVEAETEPDTAEPDGAEPESSEQDGDGAAILGGWTYLIFVFVAFVALALLAYACDDSSSSSSDTALTPTTAVAAEGALDPAELLFVVDGDKVTLSGAVPDAAAAAQLVELAEARYGEGNVVDKLTFDDGVTLDGATVTVTGTTTFGDDQPEGLVNDVIAAMNMRAGEFDVTFTEVEASPVDVEAAVSTDSVTLSGDLPDQGSLERLVEVATRVWGEGNVDAAGLSIDQATTLVGGRIQVTGTADAGDTRIADFVTAVGESFDVEVGDTVEIDTSADALARLEDRLRETLAANPILFATGSADIDPQSDAILAQSAAAINAAPGIAVEIVGHTDDQGGADVNQALSESRANAVLARLVELGVDQARLSARGAGAAEPIADNTTAEGRAANRRIAFEFAGASGG